MKKQPHACYAIVPAAGRSRRMGQSKLLLPWPGEQVATGARGHATVIDSVLEAWTSSRVEAVIVVVRADDEALCLACARWPVIVVHPQAEPPDMKASVCVGLNSLREQRNPGDGTRCFIAPADLPGLNSRVIDRLMDSTTDAQTIVLPRFGDSMDSSVVGHPALLPWELTGEIFDLPPDEGVDAIVKRHRQEYILFPADSVITDIDTPEEYRLAVANACKQRA